MYLRAEKGTYFAFRKCLADAPLQGHTEALRAKVDRSLAVFWNDHLAPDVEGADHDFTAAGRKASGSSALPGSEKNPFL